MDRSLWTAATGMSTQQMNMDVIANNLANVNTVGFKRSRANFADLMYETIQAPGSTTSGSTNISSGIQVGMGSRIVDVQKMFTQGEFLQTGNDLDLVIEGRGFFKILRNDDEVYTRAGDFKLDKDGYVCDAEGYRLQPEMRIPQDAVNVSIDPQGNISVTGQDGTEIATGNIKLYNFINPAGLLSLGRSYYLPTDASGDAIEGDPGSDGIGTISQGYLENANVNIVEEMVNMIMAQRAYEATSKVIRTSDEMMRIANNIR